MYGQDRDEFHGNISWLGFRTCRSGTIVRSLLTFHCSMSIERLENMGYSTFIGKPFLFYSVFAMGVFACVRWFLWFLQ
jgi:hypothetical protein